MLNASGHFVRILSRPPLPGWILRGESEAEFRHGHKTIYVFAITWSGEIIDVRSDVLPHELEVAEEEAAIHARIRAHIDTLVGDSG
jgi:hypothetical protein